MPERENVGNWMNGIEPKRLLTRMKKKSVKRYGTKRMKSLAADDVAAEALRTKP